MRKEKVVKIKPSFNQLQKIKFICEAMESITEIVKDCSELSDEEIIYSFNNICDIVNDLNVKVGG